MPKVQLQVSLSEQDAKFIEKIAEQREYSKSMVARDIIKNFIRDYRKENAKA